MISDRQFDVIIAHLKVAANLIQENSADLDKLVYRDTMNASSVRNYLINYANELEKVRKEKYKS